MAAARLDRWLGARDPRSYRRVCVYYILSWLFSASLWLVLALGLVVGVASSAVLYCARGPLRRRRVVYKLVSGLWAQEVFLMNLVRADPLPHVSHWDLTRDSICLSSVYFVVWRAAVGGVLSSLPLLCLVVDSTYLRAINIDLDIFSHQPPQHPLLLRLAFLAYFVFCVWACDLALACMLHVSSSAYAHVFEAPELFRRDLQSHFPDTATTTASLSTVGSGGSTHGLTTYSRVSSGRTCLADTCSPVTLTVASSPPLTKPSNPQSAQCETPPPPFQPRRPHTTDDDDTEHVAINLPGRTLAVATLAQAAPYGELSPMPHLLASSSPYDALSPPSSSTRRRHPTPSVSRALPTAVEDAHFAVYGPPCVVGRRPFALHVWMFAAQQRADMHERARTDTNCAVSREALVPRVAHGSLVHVTLDVPDGFAVNDNTSSTQTLTWHGEIEAVAFTLRKTSQATSGHALFKCTLVVGSLVSTLQTFILVQDDSMASSHGNEDDEDASDVSLELLESSYEVLPDTYQDIPYLSLEMQEWLGGGAGGDAYRARFRGQDVVVKCIRASEYGASGERIQAAFAHEAAVLHRFGHHPHMVSFVGACSDPAFPLSVVTAYMSHGSLESHFQHPATSLSRLEKDLLLADIAAATATIHGAGFVHRDLAARNCLVDDNRRGILSDFGMCRRVGMAGGACIQHGSGPLKYMAPETLQPPHGFTAKSDVYAFGVLLWETLFEVKPFASLTPLQAAVRVLEGERLPIGSNELSETHRALLAACFQEDPAHRPSMETIYHTLRTASECPSPVAMAWSEEGAPPPMLLRRSKQRGLSC
ncbi:Aste57867_17986 [Aphanomyces stellatus]|uniref:Aste57867_17986 protein n=1 Tax=Aphanomyces stellatus TaxID=120398 RepID=A0A485LAJ4_9STRA|nr:hypothetical protein As57867_017924 [Aphanomyces stellatus]VFT94725.1 Aste57867_17986 [Aphanomyces stellatus]